MGYQGNIPIFFKTLNTFGKREKNTLAGTDCRRVIKADRPAVKPFAKARAK